MAYNFPKIKNILSVSTSLKNMGCTTQGSATSNLKCDDYIVLMFFANAFNSIENKNIYVSGQQKAKVLATEFINLKEKITNVLNSDYPNEENDDDLFFEMNYFGNEGYSNKGLKTLLPHEIFGLSDNDDEGTIKRKVNKKYKELSKWLHTDAWKEVTNNPAKQQAHHAFMMLTRLKEYFLDHANDLSHYTNCLNSMENRKFINGKNLESHENMHYNRSSFFSKNNPKYARNMGITGFGLTAGGFAIGCAFGGLIGGAIGAGIGLLVFCILLLKNHCCSSSNDSGDEQGQNIYKPLTI